MYYLTAFEIICRYSLSTRWIRSLKYLAKKKIDIQSFETKGNWNNCRPYSVFYRMPRLFSHPQTLSTLCWCFDCTTTRFFMPWCSIDQVVNSCLTHWFDAAFFFTSLSSACLLWFVYEDFCILLKGKQYFCHNWKQHAWAVVKLSTQHGANSLQRYLMLLNY